VSSPKCGGRAARGSRRVSKVLASGWAAISRRWVAIGCLDRPIEFVQIGAGSFWLLQRNLRPARQDRSHEMIGERHPGNRARTADGGRDRLLPHILAIKDDDRNDASRPSLILSKHGHHVNHLIVQASALWFGGERCPCCELLCADFH
jgi:hypothetical protein